MLKNIICSILSMVLVLGFIGCGGGGGNDDTPDTNRENQDIEVPSTSISRLKTTGQIISYKEFDDGYYQRGVTPSYSRSGDIVTDNITKLQWQDIEEMKKNTSTWEEAKDYCASSILGGYNDWRLPTIVELQSIVVDGKSNPAIDTTAFLNYSEIGDCWSSTTSVSAITHAWVVYFDQGHIHNHDKLSHRHIRCVRKDNK